MDMVGQLRELRGQPAVSIVCPLDSRRPGNARDPAVLADLRGRAVEKVNTLLHGRAAVNLIARVDEALASVDLHHPSEGVAVLVSPTMVRVIALDAPVEPRVVVGDQFAIRDVVTAMAHSPRARIIVLSRQRTRCIDLTGDDAVERIDFGFPLETVAPTEADVPHGDFPLSEHEHAEAAKFVFRAVDHALGALERHDRRPLVLVGAERDLAYFDEVTKQHARVIGRVHGNYERDTPSEFARLARPALEQHLHAQEQSACDEVREAIGTHAVGGIVDAWLAAGAGRGHRLVVEDGYRFPARVTEGALEASSDDEAGSFDAVDDTVEAVIRDGGDVVVVPDESLTDLGHIALLTRY